MGKLLFRASGALKSSFFEHVSDRFGFFNLNTLFWVSLIERNISNISRLYFIIRNKTPKLFVVAFFFLKKAKVDINRNNNNNDKTIDDLKTIENNS